MVRKIRRTITKETYDTIAGLISSENFKISSIAQLLNLDRKTVRKIIARISAGERFVSAGSKRKQTCVNKSLEYTEDEILMHNLISCDNSWNLRELQQCVFNTLGINISFTTIKRKLKKLNITRKRMKVLPVQRNAENNLDERAIYANEIMRFSFENLVFLDETGFNKHTKRAYGYSLVNTPAYFPANGNKGINISLMCAINKNGCIAYETQVGAYNAERFKSFINNKLVQYFNANPLSILIMDNARIHHSKDVIQLLQEKRIPYKFLSAYSPQLNPIEEFFSMIKSKFNSSQYASIVEIKERIENIFLENFEAECNNFYSHMAQWLEKARRKEPFI